MFSAEQCSSTNAASGQRLSAGVATLLFLSVVCHTSAFVIPSVALAPHFNQPLESDTHGDVSSSSAILLEDETATTTGSTIRSVVQEGSWRVALNFGREFSTPLFDSYGTSGIRFPVVVPCDFTSDGTVQPQSSTVSYVADVNGGVTKPVQGGKWTTKVAQNKNNGQTLEFTLSFPEELKKRDVTIPAGSDLVMEVNLVSTQVLKQLEIAFSEARKDEWRALEKVDKIQAIRDSPKRWNEETQKWEHPRVEEPLSSLFSNHWTAFVKGQERRKKFGEKPRSGVELSKRPGPFPGFSKDDLVYFGTAGVIRNKSRGNMVIGTWTAEPIDVVASQSTRK